MNPSVAPPTLPCPKPRPPIPRPLPGAGKFRGSVAQVARGARSVQLDDGSILYADPATGLQFEAKYGNYRLAGKLMVVRILRDIPIFYSSLMAAVLCCAVFWGCSVTPKGCLAAGLHTG